MSFSVRRSTLLATLFAATALPAAGASAGEGHQLDPQVAAASAPEPDLRMHGAGFGHGVGMSQVGAYALGLQGATAEGILAAYYTDLDVEARAAEDTLRVGLERAAERTDLEATGGAVTWVACADDDQGPTADGCGPDADLDEVTQPQGATWVVTPTDDGFELSGPDAPQDEVTGDRLQVTHHGTTVTWPDVGDREYRHGTREFVRVETDDAPALHVVQGLGVEDYLQGVAEVPYSWGVAAPAMLEAQVIAARSYAMVSLRGQLRGDCDCHLLATAADQVYAGDGERHVDHHDRWVAAVAATGGLIGTHDGAPVQLLYSASHADRSEHVEDRPATFDPDPVVTAVHRSRDDRASAIDEVAAINPDRSWTATVDHGDVAALVDGVERIRRVEVVATTDGGTPAELLVTGDDADGQAVERRTSGGGVAGETWYRGLVPSVVTDADGRDQPDRYGDRMPSAQLHGFGFTTFVDDDGSVHEYPTEFLAAAGVANGYDDDTFRPAQAVTRAQMAAFLDRTFDLPDGAPSEGRFVDVHPDDLHGPAIHALAEADVTAGTDDPSRFAPDEPVTRAQMATFLARAAGHGSAPVDGRFVDVGDDHPHAGSIHAIADRGITAGATADSYRPDRSVTRGQMATFLHRVIELGS